MITILSIIVDIILVVFLIVAVIGICDPSRKSSKEEWKDFYKTLNKIHKIYN